jgi:hypothetical protein
MRCRRLAEEEEPATARGGVRTARARVNGTMGGATYSQPGARAPGSKILLVTISSRYVPVHQGIRAVVHQGQQMFPLFQFSRVGYLAF